MSPEIKIIIAFLVAVVVFIFTSTESYYAKSKIRRLTEPTLVVGILIFIFILVSKLSDNIR